MRLVRRKTPIIDKVKPPKNYERHRVVPTMKRRDYNIKHPPLRQRKSVQFKKAPPADFDKKYNDKLLQLKVYQNADKIVKKAIKIWKAQQGDMSALDVPAMKAVESLDRRENRLRKLASKYAKDEKALPKLRERIMARKMKGKGPTAAQKVSLAKLRRRVKRLSEMRREIESLQPTGSKGKWLRRIYTQARPASIINLGPPPTSRASVAASKL